MFVKALVIFNTAALALIVPAERPQRPQAEQINEDYAAPPISLIRLVAGCGEFQGRRVMTTGFASFEFENFSLCPSSEIAQHDPASCFWLESNENGIPHDRLKKLEGWSKTWVSIEAKVSCSEYRYAGSLEDIQLIVEHKTGKVLWSTDPALRAVMEQE